MYENNGFIIIHRKILEWEWYRDTNTKTLFIHCLVKANWKDGNFEGIKVPRGSFITSVSKLSQELSSNKQKFTVQAVRTSLKHLVSTNELTIKTTNKYTVITVNNYDLYQDINKVFNNQLTNKQQTTNKQLTTIEQYKQSNKETNNNTNNIFDFVEQNFGRTLSPVEYEEISHWENSELTRYAIKQAITTNKCSIKYISRILSAYERENIKNVQQAQERERKYNEAKRKTNYNNRYVAPVPEWNNKNITKQEATTEQRKEMEELLKEFQ